MQPTGTFDPSIGAATSRAARWEEAARMAKEAVEVLIDVQEEYDSWQQSLPENLSRLRPGPPRLPCCFGGGTESRTTARLRGGLACADHVIQRRNRRSRFQPRRSSKLGPPEEISRCFRIFPPAKPAKLFEISDSVIEASCHSFTKTIWKSKGPSASLEA
jgi:hypothetical protein